VVSDAQSWQPNKIAIAAAPGVIRMSLILFISFLLLAVLAFILYRWPRKSFNTKLTSRAAPRLFDGLFGAPENLPREEDMSTAQLREQARLISLRSEVTGALIEEWKSAPGQQTLAEMIHFAARADDAVIFQEAVEAAMSCWRAGGLPQMSGAQLLALLESAYWLIAPEARSSGAGFVLKRTLVEVRRELSAANRRASM
jgi:hypothetical protein